MRGSSLFLLIVGTLAVGVQFLVFREFAFDNPWAYNPAVVAAGAVLIVTLNHAEAVLAFLRRPEPRLFLEIAAAAAVVATVVGLWVNVEAWQEERTERQRARIIQAWNVIAQGPGAQGNIGQLEALRVLHAAGENTKGINLSGGWYARADFSAFELGGAQLDGANLVRARFGREQDLYGTSFKGANLWGAVLTQAELGGADLSAANLNRANMSSANLYGANLSGAQLSVADLTRADLTETNLSGAKILSANLSEALLVGANLSGADLYEANLNRVGLMETNLSGANLFRADLSRAHLFDANLSAADLTGADLSGADLSDAKGLTNEQVHEAFYWADREPPELPHGIDPPPARDPSERKK